MTFRTSPLWFARFARRRLCRFSSVAIVTSSVMALPALAQNAPPPAADAITSHAQFLDQYCTECHNDDDVAGKLSLVGFNPDDLSAGHNLGTWEKILRKAGGGEMPPPNREQPPLQSKLAFTGWLEAALDQHAATNPNPGRATLRRLNRAEYSNAVRDLLAIEVDVSELLPTDDSGYGFDNIADVLSMSSTLMDRYIAVAGKISRLAVGRGISKPVVTSYTVPKDGSVLNQGIPSWDERASGGMHRWYTDCCQTPIGNTLTAGWPFVGLIHSFIAAGSQPDALLGPVRAHINTQHATGELTDAQKKAGNPPTMLLRLMYKMLMWKWQGRQKPSPFFTGKGIPLSEPKVLQVDQ